MDISQFYLILTIKLIYSFIKQKYWNKEHKNYVYARH